MDAALVVDAPVRFEVWPIAPPMARAIARLAMKYANEDVILVAYFATGEILALRREGARQTAERLRPRASRSPYEELVFGCLDDPPPWGRIPILAFDETGFPERCEYEPPMCFRRALFERERGEHAGSA